MSADRDLRVNISLGDRLSAGLGQIGGSLTRLNARAVQFQDELRGNFDDMVAGFGSAMAAGASVYAAIAPGVELERALKSVGGFGLEGDLRTLRTEAQNFSREFGGTSTEFVNNAQALKRAIGEVDEAELGQITAATTKLVTATGSDIEQVSQYMGRLYHTYQDEADKIGKVDFVSHLANMNAMAVQLSGKSADHIAGAMESITSLAKNFGIGLEEQMAVVATLSMEHGEGDTASFYEAFIREGNNLAEIGIQTIGDDGQMLGMLDILDQVKAKFGEEIDANEFKAIEEVAGDSASVFATLLRKEEDFRAALGNMKAPGTDALDDLAEAHTDTIKQLGGSWGAMRENLSQAIMPVVDTVASGFIWLLDTVSDFIQAYPNLTSTVLAGVVGLTALVSVISVGSGMLAMMRTGAAALAPGMERLTAVAKVATTVMRSLNLTMLMNPVGMMAAAMVAGAFLIMRYWEPISSFFSGFAEGLRASGLFEMFTPLVGVFSWIWDKVKGIGEFLFGWLKPVEYANDELAGFASTGMMVGAMVGDFFGAIGNTMRSLFTSVIGVLNLIPGIDIELPSVESMLNVDMPSMSEAGAPSITEAASPAIAEVTAPVIGEVRHLMEASGVTLPELAEHQGESTPLSNGVTAPELAARQDEASSLSTGAEMISAEAPTLTALTQESMPVFEGGQDVVNYALNDMKPYQALTTPASATPLPAVAAAPSSTAAQTHNTLQTGDIHIHQPPPEFSLLGLDEQRILTIG